MKFIDISRPIHTGMPHWPGDTGAQFSLAVTKAGGADANVGRLVMGVHNGTHADAPYHYNEAGATIDLLPLDLFVGPAQVVDVRGHSIITPEILMGCDFKSTPRLLFKSDSWRDPAVFPAEWPLFAPETPAWLAEHGVRLVGMDVPSVDGLQSAGMPIHHLLDQARIVILENLDLSAVAPGVYELIALPLRIRGGDGSPIRAVLRTSD